MFSLKSVVKLVRTFAIAATGVFAIGLVSSTCQAQTKVACVGDSITAGYGLVDPGTESYPAQLHVLLGSNYTVRNYGVSGSTALKRSDNTYWNSWAYRQSTQWSPDIVIIMLGTNDSKAWNWDAARFNLDYKALIAKYAGLRSHPKVYICLIPPVFLPNDFGTTFDPVFIQETVVPAIEQIGAETGVPVIDNNSWLLDSPDLFLDGVHPTPEGAGFIAQSVGAAIVP